jgi:RES domain-containing protein
VLVYRICREAYRALDGEGARVYGGRWNERGVAVVYTSSSLSLAALEGLVHLDPTEVPDDLVALTIQVPDDLSSTSITVTDLPADWAQVVEHPACVALGTQWAKAGGTAVLRVPSAPVPEDENILLNPAHAELSRVAVVGQRPYTYDPRLLS